MADPEGHSGPSSVRFVILIRDNTNFINLVLSNHQNLVKLKSNELLVFGERGKPNYPRKNPSKQSREKANSIHV